MANYQRIEKLICIMRRENLSHYFINFSLHKGSYNFYGVEMIRDFSNTVNQNFNPTTESKTFYACYEFVYLKCDRSIRSLYIIFLEFLNRHILMIISLVKFLMKYQKKFCFLVKKQMYGKIKDLIA